MSHRTNDGLLLTLFGAAWLTMAGTGAQALESPDMFMHAANTNGNKTISRTELDALVDKRFDLIAGPHAKEVNSLRLGGRMTPDEFKKAQTGKHPDPLNLSRGEFKAYADSLAVQASSQLRADAPADGALNLDALRTEAGKELIRLLE